MQSMVDQSQERRPTPRKGFSPSPALTGIKLFKIAVQLSFESIGFEECPGDVADEVSDSEAGAA